MRPKPFVLLPMAIALALTLPSPQAQARAESSAGHSKTRTFSTALRYIRIDLGYEVTEKDPDSAYLLFQYSPPGRKKSDSSFGAIEVVDTDDGTKVYVSLPHMPQHHEQVLADGLIRKLKAEYGEPPRPRPAPKDQPKGEKPPADDSSDTPRE